MTYIYIYIYTDTNPITLPCSLARAGKYVPSVPYSSTGVVTTKEKASMHRIVVGGDQLTAARIRATQKGKLNGQTH